ncbi:MAG TPA: hypothetical protein VGP41_08175 [Candidatus Lustribacter sp.]|jgi:hypothetical protein|nr:hypothetical protein [Candidatus Lustribacter sp.]
MQTTRSHLGAFCALLFVLGITVAACGGGGGATPATPSVTTSASPSASSFTTASCNTSGVTSAAITGGSLAGVGTVATPAIGGCAFSIGLGVVVTAGTAGTYSGTISFAPPGGLPSLTGTTPPPGFSTANFVPLFYVTLQLSGYVGDVTPNNPNIAITVNSIATSSNSSNFFIGSWSSNFVAGAAAPAASGTGFVGWTNNNGATVLTNVPLTVTPPNMLSLPEYPCSGGTACEPTSYTTPESLTLVQVVGYFT